VLIYTYGINRMKTSGQREKLNWKQLMNVGVISCQQKRAAAAHP